MSADNLFSVSGGFKLADIELKENKLIPNAWGLFESSIMGIAGSAPRYSIAAMTVTLVITVRLFGSRELF